jgi:2-polyprenyl-3-methyl-5-hydroxy-6-metoxy-1,4-benzoquinol methylase
MAPQSIYREIETMLAVGNSDPNSIWLRHLRSKLVLHTYIRIADEIRMALQQEEAQVLDWGAGCGQMSYLLGGRGFQVTALNYYYTQDPISRHIDVKGESPSEIQTKSLQRGKNAVVSHTVQQFGDYEFPLITTTDPVLLPFAEEAFDGVLSCGVFEHVGDERGSLRELRRVLKPGGILFMYQLPQRGSWLEFVIERLKLGYAHEHKYTAHGMQQLLTEHGFSIKVLRRTSMLPKSFTGLPAALRQISERYSTLVIKTDLALACVPLLNQISGTLEIIAQKS